MYFDSFGLKNFRIFQDMEDIDFSNITLLTGANNSGKSSVIKALMLMSENAKDDKYRFSLEHLSFKGKHKLGTFNSVINKNGDSDIIKIHLPFSFANILDKMILELCYKNFDGNDCRLIELSVFLKNTKERLMHFEYQDYWNIKINFTYFKTEFVKFIEIYNDISEIREKHDRYYKDDYLALYGLINTRIIKQPLFKLANEPLFFHHTLYKKNYDHLINNNEVIEPSLINLIKKYEKIDQRADDFMAQYTDLSDDEYKQLIIKSELEFLDQIETKDLEVSKVIPQTWFLDREDIMFGIDKTPFYPNYSIDLAFSLFISNSNEDEGIIERLNDIENNKLNIAKVEDLLFTKLLKNGLVEYFELGDKAKTSQGFLTDYLPTAFKTSLQALEKKLKNTFILNTNRGTVERLYNYEDDKNEITKLLIRFTDKGFHENYKYLIFFRKYLRAFGIADDFKVEEEKEGVGLQPYFYKNGKKILLADMGYGISSILPIMLNIIILGKTNFYQATVANEDSQQNPSIFIIEEPEQNLHPKLQSQLADLFVEASELFNIQFLIETHSEYLIRKMQYLVAKKVTKPENIGIYYFYEPENVPEGEKQVKKISILPDGRLENEFGEGFFDEAAKLVKDLWEARSQN